MRLPPLETERLLIREFTPEDLAAAHRVLDVELAAAGVGTEGALTLVGRRRWLEWTVLSYEQLAYMRQPPYGDRALVLRQTGELIGSCGLVPCLAPFGRIPTLRPNRDRAGNTAAALPERYSPEVGLYWAIAPAHQRQGYATEAARALVNVAFQRLQIGRLVACTDHDNAASIGVMRKLGMRIDRNPHPQPPWLQVVGVLNCAPSVPSEQGSLL